MTDRNPFGDEPLTPPRRVNPFGEEEPTTTTPGDAATRIEQSARRIRGLRAQLGAEGLTPAGTRDLLDELSAALDAAARALREIGSH